MGGAQVGGDEEVVGCCVLVDSSKQCVVSSELSNCQLLRCRRLFNTAVFTTSVFFNCTQYGVYVIYSI